MNGVDGGRQTVSVQNDGKDGFLIRYAVHLQFCSDPRGEAVRYGKSQAAARGMGRGRVVAQKNLFLLL